MTMMRQLITRCRGIQMLVAVGKSHKHLIAGQTQQTVSVPPKVTTDSDITHNLNALHIIETVVGHSLDNSGQLYIDDRIVAKVFFDFITICPQFYSTERQKINKLVKVLPKLSDNNVIQVLKTITLWEIQDFSEEPIVRKVVNNIDNELSFRFKMRAKDAEVLDNAFFVANLFFRLNAAKHCRFNRLLIRWISDKELSLTKDQLLRLLFLINIVIDVDRQTKNYIISRTERHINDMTFDEMSVVCMTFYKTLLRLSDNLMRKVLQKSLISLSNQTNSFTKTDVLKIIRLSYSYLYKREVQSLVNRYKQLDNNIYALYQLTNLLIAAKLYDKCIFDQTFHILATNAEQIRDKYIERLLSNASEVNHQINYETILSLSQHISENKQNFEQYLGQILCHFSHYKHFPKDLIEFCFDKRFLNRIEDIETKPNDFHTSILKLNSCLSIEKFDEFSHLLLDEKRVHRYRQKSMEFQKFYTEYESRRRQVIHDLFDRLKHRLQEESLHLSYVLPFNAQPIIVILRGNCYQLNTNLKNFVLREGMFENCISVNVLHLNDYSTDDWTQLRANVCLRNRLLDRLGFRCIQLDHKLVVQMLDKKSEELERFLRTII